MSISLAHTMVAFRSNIFISSNIITSFMKKADRGVKMCANPIYIVIGDMFISSLSFFVYIFSANNETSRAATDILFLIIFLYIEINII